MVDPERDPEGTEIEYLRSLTSIHGRTILEIGCGNGRLARRLAPFASALVGIDPNDELLADALTVRSEFQEKPVSFIEGEAGSLPFSEGAFENIIFGWSL